MEESSELPRACASAAFFVQDSISFVFKEIFESPQDCPKTEFYEDRPSSLLYSFTDEIGEALLITLRATPDHYYEIRKDAPTLMKSLDEKLRRLTLYNIFSATQINREFILGKDELYWGTRVFSFLSIAIDLVIFFHNSKDEEFVKDVVAVTEAYLDVLMRDNHEKKLSIIETAAKKYIESYTSESE